MLKGLEYTGWVVLLGDSFQLALVRCAIAGNDILIQASVVHVDVVIIHASGLCSGDRAIPERLGKLVESVIIPGVES
jgi:hypothetical protein